jgi:hypothetical protein
VIRLQPSTVGVGGRKDGGDDGDGSNRPGGEDDEDSLKRPGLPPKKKAVKQ